MTKTPEGIEVIEGPQLQRGFQSGLRRAAAARVENSCADLVLNSDCDALRELTSVWSKSN